MAALRVVTTKNVVHAALYLVVVLASIAAIFVLLAAEFVAATQILVYVGAIVVLFLFGIMLTRPVLGRSRQPRQRPAPGRRRHRAVPAGVLPSPSSTPSRTRSCPTSTTGERSDRRRAGHPTVGDAIFSTYLVPFEVVSVLLLAALVGAIVLARRD